MRRDTDLGRQVIGQAGPLPGAEWEVAYDSDEPLERVTLALVDFDEIDTSWGSEERETLGTRLEWLLSNAETWDAPGWAPARGEPVTLVYECNWRDGTGAWRRMVHGYNSGRHRLVAARQLRRPTIWAKVLERLFYPPDERPPDRAEVPSSPQRRVLDARDHPNPAHVTRTQRAST